MGNREFLGERWQAKLAASFVASGEVLRHKGNLGAAVQAYKSALTVAEAFAAGDPANSEAQGEVAVCCSHIGYALICQGRFGEASDFCLRSLSISEGLHALEPLKVEWQRHVALARIGIGEVASAQGEFLKAQEQYSAALLIREALFNAHPDNTLFGSNVAYVYRVLGDDLVRQGRLEEAFGAFATALALVEALAQGTPLEHWLRATLVDLHLRMARTQALAKRRSDAIDSCNAAHAIIKVALNVQPDDVQWLDEFFWSYKTLGDVTIDDNNVQRACLELAVETAQRMVAKDPGNLKGYVRVALGLRCLSDVYYINGNWPVALEHLAAAREAFDYFVKIDPLNLDWRGDVAELVRYTGDVQVLVREPGAARVSYALSISMYESMIEIDPADGRWAKAVAEVQGQLAALEDVGHAAPALNA